MVESKKITLNKQMLRPIHPIHGKTLKLKHHPTWRTFGFSQHPFSGKSQEKAPETWNQLSGPQKEKKNYQLSGSMLNFDKFIIDLHWLKIHFDPPKKKWGPFEEDP